VHPDWGADTARRSEEDCSRPRAEDLRLGSLPIDLVDDDDVEGSESARAEYDRSGRDYRRASRQIPKSLLTDSDAAAVAHHELDASSAPQSASLARGVSKCEVDFGVKAVAVAQESR
jgi:hypothetical protein